VSGSVARQAEVIAANFGVEDRPGHGWYLLRAMGWSCQKPERRARERDEEGVARCRHKNWPRIKNASQSIVVLDETGLMLAPVVRRTWAPKACTPVMYCWDRHDRLSVIAGVSRSARRRRIGLYFAVRERKVAAG